MRLIEVGPGEFLMGVRESVFAPSADPTHRIDVPQRPVRLTKPYMLGSCEVTVGQFAEFVKATGYTTDAEKQPARSGFVFDGKRFVNRVNITSWRTAGQPTTDHPVYPISWNDALAFCEWLSKKESRAYRLPTEAEWEYACRAGVTTPFPWGFKPEDGRGRYNGRDRCFEQAVGGVPNQRMWADGYAFTSPVGSYPPNGWGFYDMIGNVPEWCMDWHAPYAAGPAVDPQGAALGEHRVIRGGSFAEPEMQCSLAARTGGRPDGGAGFRVLMELPTAANEIDSLEPMRPYAPELVEQWHAELRALREASISLRDENSSLASILAAYKSRFGELPPPSEQGILAPFGIPGSGTPRSDRRVTFVVDTGRSMHPYADLVRTEAIKAVGELKPPDAFRFVFSQRGMKAPAGAERFRKAGPLSGEMARKMLESLTFEGDSDIETSVRIALHMPTDLLWLVVADRSIQDDGWERLRALVKTRNTGGAKVNTVLHFCSPAPEGDVAREALWNIARDNGGVCIGIDGKALTDAPSRTRQGTATPPVRPTTAPSIFSAP